MTASVSDLPPHCPRPRATVRGGRLSVLVKYKRGPKVPRPFCHGVRAPPAASTARAAADFASPSRRCRQTVAGRRARRSRARGCARAHEAGISRVCGRALGVVAPPPPLGARRRRRSSRGAQSSSSASSSSPSSVQSPGSLHSSANSPNSARCGAPFGPPLRLVAATVACPSRRPTGRTRCRSRRPRRRRAHRRGPAARAPAPGPESACPRGAAAPKRPTESGAPRSSAARRAHGRPYSGSAGCRCSCACRLRARAAARRARARAADAARAPTGGDGGSAASENETTAGRHGPPRLAPAPARGGLSAAASSLSSRRYSRSARAAAAPSDGARANRASGGIVDKDVVEAPGLPKSKMSETQRPTEVSGEPGGWTSAIPVRALPGFAARFQAVIFTHLSPGGSPYEPATLRR